MKKEHISVSVFNLQHSFIQR
uniref:Uncharacterized protein n=1 Tax=Anguilla anguilla TaxID=7936 RepID=A0A0E9QEW0_ANGAN